MTDLDERTLNRCLALLGNHEEYQDYREAGIAALHRLFRDRRRLEKRVVELEAELRGEYDIGGEG